MKTIYDFSVKKSNQQLQSLQDYQDKVLLIVNTASKCGLTPQFEGLQQLYETYKAKGVEILGFPCDQFNNQEYEQIDETLQFCQVNYGVTFPIYAKVDVNGNNEDPLFTFLKDQQKGLFSKAIKWNFTKFLINQNGQVIKRYAPSVSPNKIEKDIKRLIDDKG
ncbi:glutathione peroxidase [Bacillus mesophilus]|uniref:Glutathione peroxidase n=1 Tax=Bacillus mesophilus TaxID=1808955 RepID=A0A6M0QD34_9BACI|nr:glutathione peroxidase [Bacillus mesophilus]MBM7663494.1 glutathione peroxidase [Bacillus mesophilus]NEY74157.1 glutathione peroxidase [Bacillus mesophilus]